MKLRRHHRQAPRRGSSLSRGTWIEMACPNWMARSRPCRPSHEGRGLKLSCCRAPTIFVRSSLSRGTWIEMLLAMLLSPRWICRPSHEGRGLKFRPGNAPFPPERWSSLSRGTWIEITHVKGLPRRCSTSSLSRGTWIEIRQKHLKKRSRNCRPSHEGRGLKFSGDTVRKRQGVVVPLTRDVD